MPIWVYYLSMAKLLKENLLYSLLCSLCTIITGLKKQSTAVRYGSYKCNILSSCCHLLTICKMNHRTYMLFLTRKPCHHSPFLSLSMMDTGHWTVFTIEEGLNEKTRQRSMRRIGGRDYSNCTTFCTAKIAFCLNIIVICYEIQNV